MHFITRKYGEVMAKKPVASKKPRKKQSVMDPNEQNSEPKGPGKLQKLFFGSLFLYYLHWPLD